VTADVLPRDDRRPIDASPQWRCSGFWGLLPGQPLLARFNWIAPGYIGQCALCFWLAFLHQAWLCSAR